MSFQSWLQGYEGPQVEAGPSYVGADPVDPDIAGAQAKAMAAWALGNVGQQAPTYGHGMQTGDVPWNVGASGGMPNLSLFTKKRGAHVDLDPSYYMDLQNQFAAAKDFYMSQAGPGGMLSDTSMNPYARQLGAQHQMQQAQAQRDMGYGMAASGANPFMAQNMMRESGYAANQAYGQSLAQIEEDLMNRRFAAGEGLVNLSNALGSEMTARKEEQRRYGMDYLQADRIGAQQASAARSAGKSSMMGGIIGGGLQLAGEIFGK